TRESARRSVSNKSGFLTVITNAYSTIARDLEELTHATHAELGVLLVDPGVLYGSCDAKYAAAFLKMSRSSFKRAFSFRRRFTASDRCSSWTSFSWRAVR